MSNLMEENYGMGNFLVLRKLTMRPMDVITLTNPKAVYL